MQFKDDILIENFLIKQLSKEEKTVFLKRLATDISFKEKFEFEKQLFEILNEEDWNFQSNTNSNEINAYLDVIRSDEIVNLKNQLKKENEIYKKNITKKTNPLFLYAVASIVLLFSVFYVLKLNKPSTETLYASYLEKTEFTSLITRGENTKELSKAQVYFDNKDYKKALLIFEKLIQNKKLLSGSLYIYTGVSQMELNQFDKAEKTFDNLIQSDFLDAEKGYWFKALLYLKEKNIEKSKMLLNKIVINNWYQYEEAKKLLNEL